MLRGSPCGLPSRPVVGEQALSRSSRLWWAGLVVSGCGPPAPRLECTREPGPGQAARAHVPPAALSRPLASPCFPCNVWGLSCIQWEQGTMPIPLPGAEAARPARRGERPSGERSPPPTPSSPPPPPALLGEHRPLPRSDRRPDSVPGPEQHREPQWRVFILH